MNSHVPTVTGLFSVAALALLVGLLLLVGVVLWVLRQRRTSRTGARRSGRRTLLTLGLLILTAAFLAILVNHSSRLQISGSSRTGETLAFELDAAGDQARWHATTAVAPAGEEAPPWVFSAGGSTPLAKEEQQVRLRLKLPGPMGELVGYSGLEPTREAAADAALESAQRQVQALLLWNSKKLGVWSADSRDSLEGVAAWCNEVAQRHLRSGQISIEERFDETLRRDYGDVHRSAVLIRVDDQRLQHLAEELRLDLEVGAVEKFAQRRELLRTTTAGLALALVVILLYFLFNAGTKGYFAWPLRILSLGSLIVLYVGMFYLKGWFPL